MLLKSKNVLKTAKTCENHRYEKRILAPIWINLWKMPDIFLNIWQKIYEMHNKKILKYPALYGKIYRLDMRRSERLPKAWRPTGNFRGVCPFDRAKAIDANTNYSRREARMWIHLVHRMWSWQMLMQGYFGFLNGVRKNARHSVGWDRAPWKTQFVPNCEHGFYFATARTSEYLTRRKNRWQSMRRSE